MSLVKQIKDTVACGTGIIVVSLQLVPVFAVLVVMLMLFA